MDRDPTTRFSDRVQDYVRHRPSYPSELIDLLASACGLGPASRVADIGSGTGILSRLLLERGYEVLAVEPNEAMRGAAERVLGDFERFTSIAGSAEDTTLASDSVDLVAAAQAFHWFEPDAARREFSRILTSDGWLAIIWNERRKSSSSFLRAYESLLLTHGTDYRQVDHTRIDAAELRAFFGPRGCHTASYDNRQLLDFDSLRGRLRSSSYAPADGEPGYAAMIADLRSIFDTHNLDGLVSFEYGTRVYYGQLS